jgi:hypothetical protein
MRDHNTSTAEFRRLLREISLLWPMKQRASCRSRKPRSSPWCFLIFARSPMKRGNPSLLQHCGFAARLRTRARDRSIGSREPGVRPFPRSCSRARPAARPRGARPQAPREGTLRPTHSLHKEKPSRRAGGARNCRTIIPRGFSLGQSGCRGCCCVTQIHHDSSIERCTARL